MQWLKQIAVALLAACFASCSLLVDPENAGLRCVAQSGAADPCGEVESGLVCRSGKCERCVPGMVQENCNLIDDDCDGRIDEGNDQDMDGFTWCGGGNRELADCVDTDPTIRPVGDTLDGVVGHRDVCGDGIDNDCSGVPDDAPDCDGTTDCEDADTPCATPGTCVTCPSPQECQACAVGRNCGARRSICIAPLKPGSSCSTDSDCESGICVEGAAFGLTSSVAKICSRACCADSDCGDNNICLVRGNGTRLCVPPGLVGREGARQETACTDDMECSSGACDPDPVSGANLCRRLCTNDFDCVGSPHGSACMFQPSLAFFAPVGFACGPPIEGATAQTGEFCIPNNNRCASGLCIPSLIYVSACNESCRTDCTGERTTCAYESIANFFPGETPRMPLCVLTEGTNALGQSCQESAECAEGRCIEGLCRNACCNDTDCGELRCRPMMTPDGYGMYCAP